jgi:hypothetical protein
MQYAKLLLILLKDFIMIKEVQSADRPLTRKEQRLAKFATRCLKRLYRMSKNQDVRYLHFSLNTTDEGYFMVYAKTRKNSTLFEHHVDLEKEQRHD